MEMTTADLSDLDELVKLYKKIIRQQERDEYSPRWTWGIYPSEDDLKQHLLQDRVYVVRDDNKIIAACVAVGHEEEMYKQANWSRKLSDEEICVIHLLGVDPDWRRKGVGSYLLDHLITELSKDAKGIHLDVVKENLGACYMYEKAGFHCTGDYEVFYEDTGRLKIKLMEYYFE